MSDQKLEQYEEAFKATRYVLEAFTSEVAVDAEELDEEELDQLLEDLQQTGANLIASWERFCESR